MRSLPIILLAVAACSSSRSSETHDVEGLAKQVNPILTKLQATAKKMTDPTNGNDEAALNASVELCGSRDAELQVLGDMQTQFKVLDTAPGGPDFSAYEVPTAASQIASGRSAVCTDPKDLILCAKYCADRWQHLVESVDRLNQRVASSKVKFVELH